MADKQPAAAVDPMSFLRSQLEDGLNLGWAEHALTISRLGLISLALGPVRRGAG